MQQAILQVGALDDDVIGEHEPALERAGGDAAIQHITLLALTGDAAGDHQGVLLHGQLEILGAEAGHRHGQAVGVVAGLLDVVGRVGRRLGAGHRSVHQAGHAVEADGGTEQG